MSVSPIVKYPSVIDPPLPRALPVVATRRHPAIEPLRGVACLAVLSFHSLTSFSPSDLHPVLRGIQVFTGCGWIGVYIFFAISGWCIAERVSAGLQRGEPATVFLRDRFLRIYPVYWVALALLITLRVLAIPFNGTEVAQNLPTSARGWLGDLLLLNPYLGVPATLTVSWSLVYELGFYLFASLALATWNGRRMNGRALFAAGALLCFAPWISFRTAAPWLVLDLWPNFFAGVAAWWIVRRGSRLSGGALLVALTTMTIVQAMVTGTWTSADILGRFAAFATAIALVGLHSQGERFCAGRFGRGLLWLGALSYSLYLIHIPLISPIQNLGARFVSPASPAFVVIWLLMLGAAIFGGWLLNRWVELPLQRRRKR